MSEERSKISLRSGGKRKGRPKISAPQQISNPIPQDGPSRGGGPAPADPPVRPRLRPPPMAGGKVSVTRTV